MKFLIVGFGSIGRRHFKNLLTLGERDIIFYRTGQSSLDDSALDGYQVFTEMDDALEQAPEGVIIANPTALHLDAAIAAAKRGCHLLLEKPISNNLDRIQEFSRIVRESGSRVLVGYQFRFHPNLQKIKMLLDEGVIGNPLAVRSHWGEYLPDWHPWEDYHQSYSARKDLGGGVLLTLSHTFDYLRWLFGNARVEAALLGHEGGLGIDVEDTAEILLRFDSRLIASLHLNYLQSPPRHTLEVIGTLGTIDWDYYQNRVDLAKRDLQGQVVRESYSTPDDFDRNDLFLQEMDHFREVINKKIRPLCSLEDGIQALELALQAGKRGLL